MGIGGLKSVGRRPPIIASPASAAPRIGSYQRENSVFSLAPDRSTVNGCPAGGVDQVFLTGIGQANARG